MAVKAALIQNFKYFKPSIKNNLVYLIMLVSWLLFLTFFGDALWERLMHYFSLFNFLFFGGFAFYFVLFWLLGAGYIYLYYRKAPVWLYKYKIQDHGEGQGHKVSLKKSILVVLGNQFFGTLPFLAAVVFVMLWRGYQADQAILPWYINLFHIVMMVLLQDFFFWLNHYIMHKNKWLFKHVHSVHHQYRESIAITTHYVHYVEHIMGNLFPVFIGAIIFLPHPLVFMFWILIIVINALHNHSGFAFPYLSYSVHHDWHHYYVNSSYSSIGLCDKLFGTDKPFEEMINLKKE